MQVEGNCNTDKLDTAVVNYISELKSNYEQRITELQNNYNKQEQQIIKYKNESIEYYNQYIYYKEQYTLLTYKRFARSAEQLSNDNNQPVLFTNEVEPEEIKEEEAEEKTEVKSYTRKKPGRKPIDPKIERRPRYIDIPESGKTCACGAKLTKIGDVTSEKLVIIPAEVYVDEIHRFKYACRCCEGTEDEDNKTVRIAPVEPSMIPHGIATPSLLATVLTQKFEDHLPYERQEKQFERIGVELSKQNMSNWQQKVFEKLTPLFDLIKKHVKSGPVLQQDETTVRVIGEENRNDTRKSYMWVTIGGWPDRKAVWYEYHRTRAGENAKEFLKGYSGYLQTDGYKGYDYAVKDNPNIIHVGCFAHARRKFFEASKATKTPQSAEEGMKYIRKLYELEKELRNSNLEDEIFLAERKARAGPILEKFKSWLLKRKVETNPSSLLGKAVDYTLDQWDKLTAYLDSPYLTPDNNSCENAIRPFVVGRKNWLFCGSPKGAESSCGIYSLVETAKQNNIEPFKYLMTLFEKAPYASTPEDWEKLLPWNIEIK